MPTTPATINSDAKANAIFGFNLARTQTAARLPNIFAIVIALVLHVAAETLCRENSAVMVLDINCPATQQNANKA